MNNTGLNYNLPKGQNTIDLGKYYGINNSSDMGSAPIGQIIPGVTSLEQIASYNQQLLSQRKKEDTAYQIPNVNNSTSNGMIKASGTSNMPTIDKDLNPATPEELQRITENNQPYPISGESIQYLNGFLRTQIGRKIKADFLVGSDSLITKEGYLLGIGANYILINESYTNDITTCDFYNLKFVTVFY